MIQQIGEIMKTYPNYKSNQMLRKSLKRKGFSNIKIVNGKLIDDYKKHGCYISLVGVSK